MYISYHGEVSKKHNIERNFDLTHLPLTKYRSLNSNKHCLLVGCSLQFILLFSQLLCCCLTFWVRLFLGGGVWALYQHRRITLSVNNPLTPMSMKVVGNPCIKTYTVRILCGDLKLTMLQLQLCRDYVEFMSYLKPYYGTRLGIT